MGVHTVDTKDEPQHLQESFSVKGPRLTDQLGVLHKPISYSYAEKKKVNPYRGLPHLIDSKGLHGIFVQKDNV